jgi:hypothetical protein
MTIHNGAPQAPSRRLRRPALALSTAATRPGRSAQVSGANWTPASSGTVPRCDSAGDCTAIGAARSNASGRPWAAGLAAVTVSRG